MELTAVSRMFSNAILYNPTGHPVHEEARRLQRVFYKMIENDILAEVADAIGALYSLTCDGKRLL